MLERFPIALTVAAAIALTIGAIATWPGRAECAYCYRGPCYGNAVCGVDCQCMRQGYDKPGQCVTFKNRAAPE